MPPSIRYHKVTPVIIPKLYEFFVEDKYCDVNILVGAQTFSCHRLVLAGASEYFDTMFGGRYREANAEDVTLHDVDPSAFSEILKFAYTNSIHIRHDNVYPLLVVSEYLRVSAIQHLCTEYLKEYIPYQHAPDIFLFARATSNLTLEKILQKYLIRNFCNFSKTDQFLELPADDLHALLQDNALNVTEVDQMMDAVVRWMYHSRDKRLSYRKALEDILLSSKNLTTYVRFVTQKYFTSDPAPIAFTDHYARKKSNLLHMLIVSSGLEVISLDYKAACDTFPHSYTIINEQCLIANNSPYYRLKTILANRCLYCLGYGDRGHKFFTATSLNQIVNNFRSLKPPPLGFFDYSMSTLRNERILLYNYSMDRTSIIAKADSTFTKGELFRGVYAYNCELNKWFSVSPMKTPVQYACITSDDNLLYMVGGQDISSPDRTNSRYLQAYDDRQSQWNKLPEPTNAYEAASCCIHKDKLYVSGGMTSNGRKAEIFDPVAGKWQKMEPMNERRMWHKLLSYHGVLWAIGGCGYDLTLELYDETLQKWQMESELTKTMANRKAFNMLDAIVL